MRERECEIKQELKPEGYMTNKRREIEKEWRRETESVCLFVCFYMKMNFAYRFQIFQCTTEHFLGI